MGLFTGAMGALTASKAYRAHVKGNELAQSGKVSEARQKYTEALSLYEQADQAGQLRPNIAQAYVFLMLREGQFEKAKEAMLKMQQRKDLSPDNWFSLRLHYSIYQWKTGELDKAIETIDRAAREKTTSVIYSTKGIYLIDKARQTGNFEEAQAFNDAAMEYDDEDAEVLDNVAALYDAMSQAARNAGDASKADELHRKAKDYYRKAYKLKPRQVPSLYALAKYFHEDGEDEKARKVLSTADTLYITALCPVTRKMMDDLIAEVG